MIFDFVADNQFKDLLQRDYKELKSCLEIKAAKSVLVLSGSIIEALLIEYFLQFSMQGKMPANIYKLNFEQLLDLAEAEELLSKKEKNLAWVIKDYRNLIHPGREIRKSERFSMDDASIAHALVGIVVAAIETKYKETYGYQADDIIQKLKYDWQFRSVFEKVILKLNQVERVKLLNKLIEEETYQKSFFDNFVGEGIIPQREINNLEATKEFVSIVKPLVSNDQITAHLKQMVREMEAGDQMKAFVLYNLFHEELSCLTADERDMVVIYILSLFTSLLDNCRELAEEKTFSTIGKYIGSSATQKALIEFSESCAIHFDENSVENEMAVFDHVYNALSESNKELIQQKLTAFLPSKKLPTNIIKGFYNAAISRGILKSDT